LGDNTIKINAKITGSGVAFVIIRQIKFELYSGLLSRDGVLGKIPVNSIDCEAVQGDLIVFDKPNEPALEIVGVENGLIKTVPTFTSSTSTTGAKILRKSLEVSDVASILIESVEGTKCIISNTLNAYYLRIQPGDKLVSPDVESLVTFVSTNNYVHCYPPIHAGNYRVKRSVDTNQSSDYQDAVDEFCKSYQDVSYIKLSEFLITFSSGRFNIPNDLTSFLKPADIVYTSSDNDVGEGKGVYRIVNTIGDMAEICHDLTGDFLCSIIRQVPLRRLYIDDTGIINKLPQILQGPNI
jgi:hypothetical protein